jgi:hypothetical protein
MPSAGSPAPTTTPAAWPALLEVARLLGSLPVVGSRPVDGSSVLTAPVELVAYSTEEPPYFGSANMGSAWELLVREMRMYC